MGNKGSVNKQDKTGNNVNDVKPPKKQPYEIEELSEYRLRNEEYEKNLYEATNAFFEEVVMPNLISKNNKNDDDQNEEKNEKDNEYPLENDDMTSGSNLTDKIVFGGLQPGQQRKNNLEYFTKDVFESWTWPLYMDGMIQKSSKYNPIFQRAIYHFKQKFDFLKTQQEYKDMYEYHNSQTLAKNQLLDFLWIFIGYQFWATNSCEYTLGDENVMFDFLCKLSLLFKAIMIAYTYEMSEYKKVVNHYMKPCLTNINKDVINRAQQIAIRKKLKKKKNNNNNSYDDGNMMAQTYEMIIMRMEGCRDNLLQNGIEMKRL